MSGLQRICKHYGGMKVVDKDGNEVHWVWDYHLDKARIKDEMTQEEIALSEKARWTQLMTDSK